jgi:hypothetical protein
MKKSILSILAIVLLIGTAIGAIYVGYNHIATAYIDVDEPTDIGIETLAKQADGTFSESVTLADVAGGESVEILFRHTSETDLTGNILYEITCVPGMVYNGNSLEDFKGINYNDGIMLHQTGGNIIMANTIPHMSYSDGAATINVEKAYTFTANTPEETKLVLFFDNDSYGQYEIRSYVNV